MRILCILNQPFSKDSRTRREIGSLLARDHEVHVIAYRDNVDSAWIQPRVQFYELPVSRHRRGKFSYIFEYACYVLLAAMYAAVLQLKYHYAVVQVGAMPECLILASLPAKILGARVILDWMDPSYEVYRSKYPSKQPDPLPTLLKLVEASLIHLADAVMVPNLGFCRAFRERGLQTEKFAVVMNSADPALFVTPPQRSPPGEGLTLLFHGDASERNGLDVAIEAAIAAASRIPQLRLVVAGDGPDLECVKRRYLGRSGPLQLEFAGWQELHELPALIARCDVGIISNRETPFTRINLPQRLFEYGAMRKPVVCTSLPGIRDYFDEDCIIFCKPGDPSDLARCILELHTHPHLRTQLAESLSGRCRELSWGRFERVYLKIIERLGT